MKLIIEPEVDRVAIESLCTALEAETFAEACCIGAIDAKQVYLRCPCTKHGVILNAESVSDSVVRWAIVTLRDSVSLSLS